MGIEVIDILGVTAELGCDGNTIAMTAAMPSSIEDIGRGIIPGISQVHFRNPVRGVGGGKAIEIRHAPLFAAHLA